ncbi:hypothetical protein PIIN_01128 [Serendipita indica DSM 11827]|uniref:Cytochrome P450 n=1 Tax=Serendipita indica (strain DSM 11827) TaxID=1109443 RepID=G4T7K0_SERID|nr:hypothetical protein PIIN_01128 [Serendipita indica DSM 11827]
MRCAHPYLKFVENYGAEPTYRPLLDPLSAPSMVFGPGLDFFWEKRSTLFQNAGKTVITLEPKVWGSPIMCTNSLAVVRQITGPSWRKPDWYSNLVLLEIEDSHWPIRVVESVSFWGHNLLSSQLDEGWRKHRRILQPAFNNKLYEDVWNESTRLCHGMLGVEHFPTSPGGAVSVSNLYKLTARFTLCVILACGFGYPLAWDEKLRTPDEDITIDEGIAFNSENLILVTYAPRWLFKLPIKKCDLGPHETVTNFWKTAVHRPCHQRYANLVQRIIGLKETRSCGSNQRGEEDLETELVKRDIFTRLALASQMQGKYHLNDDELNVWVQMFAGHETSASALASCLCFLAMHKGEQDIVYEEIQTVLKTTTDGRFSFEHYDQLVKTRSAFVEALRLVPPANLIIRESKDDCILQASRRGPDGSMEQHSVLVPKGAIMVVDFIGMHYDPETFPNPTEFQPSRWYDASTDEAYSPFSTGPRVCIGRRFALVESVAFLCSVLKDYKVEPFLKAGETADAWSTRVLQRVNCRLTMALANTPLTFKRR